MDILTDGKTFAHARPGAQRGELVFELASDAPLATSHDWWGLFRENDVVTFSASAREDRDAPRAELLDAFFEPVAASVGGEGFRIPRTGIFYLRIHGRGPARLHVQGRPVRLRWRNLRRAAAAAVVLLTLHALPPA